MALFSPPIKLGKVVVGGKTGKFYVVNIIVLSDILKVAGTSTLGKKCSNRQTLLLMSLIEKLEKYITM